MLKELVLQDLDNKRIAYSNEAEEEKANYSKAKLLKSLGKNSKIGLEYENARKIADNINKMAEFIEGLEFIKDSSIKEEYYIKVKAEENKLLYNDEILNIDSRDAIIIVLTEIYLNYGGARINTRNIGNLPDVSKEMIEINNMFSSDAGYEVSLTWFNKSIESLLQALGYFKRAFNRYFWVSNYTDLHNCFYDDNLKIPRLCLKRVAEITEEVRWQGTVINVDFDGKLSVSKLERGRII